MKKKTGRNSHNVTVTGLITGITLVAGILLVSLIVGLMVKIPRPPFIGGTEEGWLGYWGSIIGIVGAYTILHIQLKNDRNQNQIQNIDNTFFQLLDMTNKQFEKKNEELSHLYNEIKEKKVQKDKQILKREENSYIKNNEQLIHSLIDDLNDKHIHSDEFKLKMDVLKNSVGNKDIETYLNIILFPNNAIVNRYPVYYLKRIFYNTSHYYRQLIYYYPKIILEIKEAHSNSSTPKKNLEYLYKLTDKSLEEISNDIDWLAKRYEKISNSSDLDRVDYANDIEIFLDNYLDEFNKKFKNMINDILPISERPSFDTIEYTKEEKKEVIQDSFDSHFPIIRQNFRIFYRVIKYLNENKNLVGENQWRNYIGFLKAGFDEEILCLIFYNAAFTKAGEKMGIELKKTHFFGDIKDFSGQQHSYFSKGTLLWATDIEDLKSITNLENK